MADHEIADDGAFEVPVTREVSKVNLRKIQRKKIILIASSSKVDHSALLMRQADADCSFTFKGQTVYGHRFILEICCPNLFLIAVNTKKKSLAKAKGQGSQMMSIEIDDKRLPVSPKTIVTLLKFLYSGNMNFFKMDVVEVFEVLIAAKTYELTNLVLLCQHWLIVALDGNTWFYTLKESRRLKLQEAVYCCKEFARNNFEEILVEKHGIVALGIDLFHEIVSFIHMPQERVELPGLEEVVERIRSEQILDFERIYSEMMRADAFFNHRSVLCHSGIVLTQCSEMNKVYNASESLIKIPAKYNFNDTTSQILLHFLYSGNDDKIHPYNAMQLIGFATDFGLSKLVAACEHQLSHGINFRTVVDLILIGKQLASNCVDQKSEEFKQIREVQLKCYNFIFKNFREFQFRQPISIDILMDIIYIFRAEKVSNAKNQGQEMARKRSDNQLQKKMYNRQLSRTISYNAFREIHSHGHSTTITPSNSNGAIQPALLPNATPSNPPPTTTASSTTASAQSRPTREHRDDDSRSKKHSTLKKSHKHSKHSTRSKPGKSPRDRTSGGTLSEASTLSITVENVSSSVRRTSSSRDSRKSRPPVPDFEAGANSTTATTTTTNASHAKDHDQATHSTFVTTNPSHPAPTGPLVSSSQHRVNIPKSNSLQELLLQHKKNQSGTNAGNLTNSNQPATETNDDGGEKKTPVNVENSEPLSPKPLSPHAPVVVLAPNGDVLPDPHVPTVTENGQRTPKTESSASVDDKSANGEVKPSPKPTLLAVQGLTEKQAESVGDSTATETTTTTHSETAASCTTTTDNTPRSRPGSPHKPEIAAIDTTANTNNGAQSLVMDLNLTLVQGGSSSHSPRSPHSTSASTTTTSTQPPSPGRTGLPSDRRPHLSSSDSMTSNSVVNTATTHEIEKPVASDPVVEPAAPVPSTTQHSSTATATTATNPAPSPSIPAKQPEPVESQRESVLVSPNQGFHVTFQSNSSEIIQPLKREESLFHERNDWQKIQQRAKQRPKVVVIASSDSNEAPKEGSSVSFIEKLRMQAQNNQSKPRPESSPVATGEKRKSLHIENLISQIQASNRQERPIESPVASDLAIKSENTKKLRSLFEDSQRPESEPILSKQKSKK